MQVADGADIQAAVNANAGNTTFCIQGLHRIATPIVPKAGDVLQGQPGATINGSQIVTGWTFDGSRWVSSWTHGQPSLSGVCASGTTCEYSDDAFLDSVHLTRVLSLSQVGPGKVYIDYSQSKIYIGDDPTAKTLEVAVAPAGIDGNQNGVDNVTVTGLLVEKCANVAQYAALARSPGSGWVIENNDVRLNHGVGIEAGSGAIASGNHIHDQGQMGMMGYQSTGAIVQNNEIDHNNSDGFDQTWEAGGGKWSKTTSLTVTANNVHDNHGTGLWFDTDNIYTVVSNNTVKNNDHNGIKYEVSYQATITSNVVTGNGFISSAGGAAINVEASPNVEVSLNTVTGNKDGINLIAQNRGSGAYGSYVLSNAYVHDNTVSMSSGDTGLINYTSDQTYFTSKNNWFVKDAYTINCSSPKVYDWMGGTVDQKTWQSYGQDVTGTFSCM